MSKIDRRTQMLEAAIQIVNEQGTDSLTLDAVAKRAEVSKGGLLYHFKNKKALIQGLVDYASATYRNNVDTNVQDNDNAGKLLRGYIEATRSHRDNNIAISSAVLAAQGNDRSLLKPLQETYEEWQHFIEDDGLNPVDATIIRLAIDGLWLTELFGLDAIDESRREKVLNQLSNYTNKN